MADDNVKELIERAGHARDNRQLMQNVYQDAMWLGNPHREDWNRPTAGREIQRTIYDSTFQNGLERLTNALYTGMFAPWLKWFELAPGEEIGEEEEDFVREQLQAPAQAIRTTLLRSNFYAAIHPMLSDLIIGTGIMMIEEDPDTDINFTPIPLSQAGLEEGRNGRVEGLFRHHEVTGRQAIRDFGEDALGSKLSKKCMDDPKVKIELISCMFQETQGLTEWVQKVIYVSDQRCILERRFFSQPFIAPRWSVLTGEIFGRGPGVKVAADAYSLNEAARLLLMQANLHLFGMYTSTDTDINPETLELGPAAIIPVSSNDNSNPTLKPLPVSGSIEIGDYTTKRLESSIKQGLFRDNLGQVEGPKMTATEVIERQSLVMQDMGAAFGRINTEGTDIIIARTAEILTRRGKFPAVKVDGKAIKIDYTSPLARAQQSEEVMAIRNLVADAVGMTQIDPSAAARIDTGVALKRIAANTGVDLDVVRDDEHVAEIMNKMAAAQQQAATEEAVA